MKRRLALLKFFGALVVATSLLEAIAVSPVAHAVFETLALRWLWPLAVVALGLLYFAAGRALHRKNGQSQHFPWLARLAVLALFAGALVLIGDTAVEWTGFETAVAMVLLTSAAIPGAIGYVAYTECWRARWNYDVVDAVLATLPGGREPPPLAAADGPAAVPKSPSEFRQMTELLRGKRTWASAHCLEIVDGAFSKRSAVLDTMKEVETGAYDLSIETGDDLLDYMALGLSEDVEPSRRTRLLNELLAIWLRGDDDQREKHQPRAKQWIVELRRDALKDLYSQFRLACYDLADNDGEATPQWVRRKLKQVLDLYEKMTNSRGPEGVSRERRVDCQNMWLAYTRRAIGSRSVYDAWMAMRRLESQGPFIPKPDTIPERSSNDDDKVLLAARAFLAEHYERWARETHEDWRQGLRMAAAVMEGGR